MASLRALVSEKPKPTQTVEEQKQVSTTRKEFTSDQFAAIPELQKIFTQESYENIKTFVLQFSTSYEIEEAVRRLLEENLSIKDSLSNWSEVTNKYKKSKQTKPERGAKRGGYARRQEDLARPQDIKKEKPAREENTDRNYDTSRRVQRPRNNPNYQRKYKPAASRNEQPTSTGFEEPIEVSNPVQVLPKEVEVEVTVPVPETQLIQPVVPEKELPLPEKKPEPSAEQVARKPESLQKYSVFDEEPEPRSFVDSHKVSKGYDVGIFGSVLKDEIERGIQTEPLTKKDIGIQAGVMIGGIPCMIYPQRPEDFARLREMLFGISSS